MSSYLFKNKVTYKLFTYKSNMYVCVCVCIYIYIYIYIIIIIIINKYILYIYLIHGKYCSAT